MDEYWHWINVKVKWEQNKNNNETNEQQHNEIQFKNIRFQQYPILCIDFKSASQQHSRWCSIHVFRIDAMGDINLKRTIWETTMMFVLYIKIYKNLILYEKFIYFFGNFFLFMFLNRRKLYYNPCSINKTSILNTNSCS